MKINLPVTQIDYPLPDDAILVSTTDLRGRITHCNQGFVDASGFDYEELLGQPHDIVRHPDMPPEAFKDLWTTIGHGRPWSGIVKNRRKNGDHYWIQANVTPVLENGKPKAYVSVRLKPGAAQVQAAQALYARIAQQRDTGHPNFKLHGGQVRPVGWRDGLGKLNRLSLTQRAGAGLLLLLALILLPGWLPIGLTPSWVNGLQLAGGLLGVAALLHWFKRVVVQPLARADRLASEIAGCNLNGNISFDSTQALGSLMRRLWLINLNLRAIVSDVRSEVGGVTQAVNEILDGSIELSSRTDAQAQGVAQTSVSVEKISDAVRATAQTAQSLASLSSEASSGASDGALSVDEVLASMRRIEASSHRITDIIDVIEKLAFQTNLLALNAAVEAAHAGPEGRGFAVVATEVRALAHRSSTAAQQIRDLIQASAQQISQGTQTVDAAAGTIRHAVEQVHRVTESLGEITLSTRAESADVSQISDAMRLLDEVTHQNASLVQQSMQACEDLSKRAGTLKRSVEIFSVNLA
jgi:aerotaxis receptor